MTGPGASTTTALAREARGLTRCSLDVGTAGALLAFAYGVVAFQGRLSALDARSLLAATVVLGLAARGLAGFSHRSSLIGLDELVRRNLPPDRSRLKRTIVEVFAFPDQAFRTNLVLWSAVSLCLGLAFRMLTDCPLDVALRAAFVGLVFAPVTSVFTQLVATRRARRTLEALHAVGLTNRDLLDAAPARRMTLRTRLMIFMAVSVLTPCVLMADLAVARAERILRDVIAQPTAELQAVAFAEQGSSGLWPIVFVGALVIGVMLIATWTSGTTLSTPMRAISEQANRLAAGDLTHSVIVAAEDELWAASSAFARMREQLTDALGQLRTAGFKLSSASEQLVSTTSGQEAGVERQSSALTETASTTEELARSARHISTTASDVARSSHEALTQAQAGMRSAEAFTTSVGRTRTGNQEIADAVVKLNKRVQQIGRIVEFINGVADKSDLLALNAELEGTKAGEIGRGFSLIAGEMRRLAEGVMRSTAEINGLIDEIRDATNAAVMATEAGVKATDCAGAIAQKVTENLRFIVDVATHTSDAVRSISLATQQQQTGTDQLVEAMMDILRTTQEGSMASRQVVQANNDLSNLARELKQVVERFQVSEP